MCEHEHLNLIDLWLEQLQFEKEYEEDEEKNDDVLIPKQDFRCLCVACEEEINWFHRYYYTCCQCNDYSIHKFCAELPKILEDICAVGHILNLGPSYSDHWQCSLCAVGHIHKPEELNYECDDCDFYIDVNCATRSLQTNIIHHPSHKHPLVSIPKEILAKCDACTKEHKGFFYHCSTCACRSIFIHSHCAFLPTKLQIQDTTNDIFSHIHPLTLVYFFPQAQPYRYIAPRCRVCRRHFFNRNIWMYKCDKCRYYAHIDCAVSRKEPFMLILSSPGTGETKKNYEDKEHPDILHLPFPDASYSLLKHLFFKTKESSTSKRHDSHQHPLILDDARRTNVTSLASPRIKSVSYHDPMNRIELLCNGCLRPITSGPIYMCADEKEEHCNFVLHEWCSRLPTQLKAHFDHPQHTLVLRSKIPRKFFSVFQCDICYLPCNGFGYYCEECGYHIDVICAFLPTEITHTSHPYHLLTRNLPRDRRRYAYDCRMCPLSMNIFSFSCLSCDDFHLHPKCALLLPETTMHKCDKHPMKLSYFPIENHKSDYFCEICEEELDPQFSFYHCHECMQSIHTACAPSILQYETYATYGKGIYEFINVKFGGTYNNIKVHPHSLLFVQGIENDGDCTCTTNICGRRPLQYNMIFKCLSCEFAIHYKCCKRLSK